MDIQNVYIIDALRTPLGRVNGKLRALSVAFLIKEIIQQFIQRQSLTNKQVDEVVFGNAVSAGAGQNFVREGLISSGLPETVPGYAVSNVCASGLQAVFNACQTIRTGDADLMIAGGVESVSNMPELIFKKNHDLKKMKNLTESLMHDGLWCSVANRWMGLLCEDLTRAEKISKEQQDDYAFQSYTRAAEAQIRGDFKEEIFPIRMAGGKIFDEDETIRKNISREIFNTFESAFEHKGTITAANSAAPCDGGAGFVLASAEAVDIYSFKPLASVVACVSVAGAPKDIFRIQNQAIETCLRKAGMSLSQIDLFEISEAFAAQMVFMQKKMPIPSGKLNISGGDIVLGHPLGAAGARTLATLVHGLKRKNKRYGLACVSLGGGGALAVIIKRA